MTEADASRLALTICQQSDRVATGTVVLGTRFRSQALAFVAVPGVILGACSSNSPAPSGIGGRGGAGDAAGIGGSSVGAGGTAGRSVSDGASGSCSNGLPCGGDLAGTWTAMSACLRIGGELDLSLVGTGCLSAPVVGSLQVTGAWTANANGTYADDTTTKGEAQLTLAPSCLVISSTPVTCDGAASIIKSLGFESLACTPAADGGCKCSGTINQTGGLGVLSVAPSTTGNYATAGNVVTITGDAGDTKYSYCAANGTLTVTPESAKATLTGTIVLGKASSPAAGGAGGGAGRGGAAGSGGVTGSGGLVGRGGGPGTAGMPSNGGRAGGLNGTGGSSGSSGASATSGAGGSAGGSTRPCDIYKAAGNPCVAAHSTVRALFGSYGGKLYQVRNSAGSTQDIPTLTPGGFADGAAQDAFCTGTTCVITVVYDQSGKGNDLWYQGSTQVPGSTSSSPSKATTEALTLSGHKVYSLYVNPGNSYWVDASKSGIALGADPEGMYMVTSSKHYNSGCCFDYGNSETDRKADGSGAMDALNFSAITAWGTGAGNGPWVMADLEYGVFAQNNTNKNQNDPSQTSPYVTALLKNDGKTEFALRGADATTGNLGTYYKGALPGGWSPMKKQGAIVLGSGGDCCKPGGGANLSDGTFYEGCIVTGYPSDATEDAVQANVVAAGYGK